MGLKLSNNASGLLALAISDSATSLTLRSGHGSRFPALSSGYWFPITVVRASDPSKFEIMRCTARSGDTLTVERAQEGTSAITFSAGDVVELRLTAGTLEENFPQVEGRNAKNLRFIVDSVGGKPELKFKSGNNEETVVRQSDIEDVVRLSDLGTAATRDVGTGADQVPTNGMLGTAATHDVTTSQTDRTVGRLVKVGDFGVGGTIWLSAGDNLNDLTTPGEYHQSANANALPQLNYPAQLAGALKVMQAASGVVQEYTTYGSTRRKFLRGLYNGSWSGWVEFYHSGNQPSLIGVGQTWQNVKSSRSLGTTYTNTTGRPIMVSISLPDTRSDPTVTINVGGVDILVNTYDVGNNAGSFSHSFIVPVGATYRISVSPSVSITSWAELR